MKKNLCPYCNQINVPDIKICSYCFEEIDSSNEILKLRRKLLVASKTNNSQLIMEAAKRLLLIDNNHPLGNYFFAYGQLLAGDKTSINAFLKANHNLTNDDLKEIIYHLIRYQDYFNYEDIKQFITKNVVEGSKIKYYCDLLDHNIEIAIDIKTLPLLDLPVIPYKNKIYSLATFLVISGFVLMFLLYFLVCKNFSQDVIIFSTILTLLFPCLLIAMGLTRFLFKKGSGIITFLLMFIILTIISYCILLPFENNFFNHVQNVITSPYDLLMYFIRKGFIGLWE